MKFNIEVDLTPEELRRFLGLPDVQSLQNEIINNLREKMTQGIDGFDPMNLMKMIFPDNLQTLQTMQKQFWETWMKNPVTAKKAASSDDK
ncbi:MAG: hypothetical protein KIT27_07030 [Legionellales bacterium]|nr:hypothetical protein [Legionellales bacterium]